MGQDDDATFDGPAHGFAELGNHGAHQPDRYRPRRLVAAWPAVEVNGLDFLLLEPVTNVLIEKRREFLIALDQARQSAGELAGDGRELGGIGRLDGLIGREFGGQFGFGDQDGHSGSR